MTTSHGPGSPDEPDRPGSEPTEPLGPTSRGPRYEDLSPERQAELLKMLEEAQRRGQEAFDKGEDDGGTSILVPSKRP